jgi:hypothetical protein
MSNNQADELCCDEIIVLLKSFLKDNGGHHNGYMTYVEGEVWLTCHGGLNWMTPKSRELSINEHHRKGVELNKAVSDIMSKYDIDRCIIECLAQGHGIFEMRVNIMCSQTFRGY